MPMSKKTYEAVAQVLNTELREGGDEATVASIVNRLVRVFETDNWAFQRDLFIQAAMSRPVPEGQQHVTVICSIEGCGREPLYEGPLKGSGKWAKVCEKDRWRIMPKDRSFVQVGDR